VLPFPPLLLLLLLLLLIVVISARSNNYSKALNHTQPYCGPHCGPSAVVKSFSRATWGYFSAVCFNFGRALLRDTGRPQGMLESCWGGTGTCIRVPAVLKP